MEEAAAEVAEEALELLEEAMEDAAEEAAEVPLEAWEDAEETAEDAAEAGLVVVPVGAWIWPLGCCQLCDVLRYDRDLKQSGLVFHEI